MGGAASQEGDVTINLSNESNTAWIVTSVDGGNNVAETDTQNPTLNFDDGSALRLRDIRRSHRLSRREWQLPPRAGQPQGTLEDNSEVNFTDEGGSVMFTLTPELAEQLATYSSTVYPAMSGSVEVSQ